MSAKAFKGILAIAVFLACGSIFAQPPGRGRGGQQGPPPIPTDKQVEQMVSELADEIGISEEQERAILDLHKKHFAQAKRQTTGNRRPSREEMEASRDAFEEEVKAELTTEQKSKFEMYLKNQKKQRPKR